MTASPHRILVFRTGQLGDTIVALPAMWLVKKHFPHAHMALLCDYHPGKHFVLASDLLRGSGLFNEILSYPVINETMFRPIRMIPLLMAIRSKRFDTMVYLAHSNRSPERVGRDHRFFSLAGIRTFIGTEGFPELKSKHAGLPLQQTPHESDLLLNRLRCSGLRASAADSAKMELGIGAAEEQEVERWLNQIPFDGGRAWVAVGPGSKMPAKRWPVERFGEVVGRLIEEFDIWPVVFGGREDRIIGEVLLKKWNCGHNAAGSLGLRGALAALKRCALFLGNDTGTMHMAAAVGVRCVAIFSSREPPGMWFPYGAGHRVFRSQIDCEGCRLLECLHRQNECLNRISTAEVLVGCEAALRERLSIPEAR